MFGTQPRKQATGRRRSDAAQLHEPLTTRILMRDFSDCDRTEQLSPVLAINFAQPTRS
jgi:hypothetical protein